MKPLSLNVSPLMPTINLSEFCFPHQNFVLYGIYFSTGNKTLLKYDDTWEELINIYFKKGYIISAEGFPSAKDLHQLGTRM